MPAISKNPTIGQFLLNGGFSMTSQNKNKQQSFIAWLTMQVAVATIGYANPVAGAVAQSISDNQLNASTKLEDFAQYVLQNATPKGKEMIEKAVKQAENVKPFKSKWIKQAVFLPSPTNENFGSFLVSYDLKKQGITRNIITINKFSRDFYNKWLSAPSIGRFYNQEIAINKREYHSAIANALFTGILFRYQATNEQKAFKNFVELSDQQAYDKHIAESNVWYNELKLDKIVGNNEVNRVGQSGFEKVWTKDIAQYSNKIEQYERNNKALDWIIKNQHKIKFGARFVSNPVSAMKGYTAERLASTSDLSRDVFNILRITKEIQNPAGAIKRNLKVATKNQIILAELDRKKKIAEGKYERASFIKDRKAKLIKAQQDAVLPTHIVKRAKKRYNNIRKAKSNRRKR